MNSRSPEAQADGGFDTLQMPKAASLAAASIRRRIVRGELQTDDALPHESELMRQFGISRPTLREALRILEAEGLILVRRGAHGGARVQAPSPDTAVEYVGLLLEFNRTSIADVLATQAVLEVGAVRSLAERAPADAIARLTELLEIEKTTLGDNEKFNDAAARLHAELVELAGSQTLALMGHMISKIIMRHGVIVASAQRRPTSRVPAWQTKSHEIHCTVVDLIKQKDSKQAAELWVAHCRANREATLSATPKDTVLDLFD